MGRLCLLDTRTTRFVLGVLFQERENGWDDITLATMWHGITWSRMWVSGMVNNESKSIISSSRHLWSL